MTSNNKRLNRPHKVSRPVRSGTFGLLGMIGIGLGLSATAAISACKPGDSAAMKAVADVQNADGESVGTATFEEVAGGVKIHFEGENLPPGPHGFHIHERGQCDAPTFESAGDHFNPTNAKHGFQSPDGPHVGDLPNLEVAANGTVEVDVIAKGASLEPTGDRSLIAGEGTALVVHANEDDQMTDPAGAAGDRIACGVIKRQ